VGRCDPAWRSPSLKRRPWIAAAARWALGPAAGESDLMRRRSAVEESVRGCMGDGAIRDAMPPAAGLAVVWACGSKKNSFEESG